MDNDQIECCLNVYTKFKNANDQLIRQGLNNYSLLNAVLKINDETRLHSKFIVSMINPRGAHFQGSLFLKIFLQQITAKLPSGFLANFDYENAVITREKDHIDILIHDGNKFIIIENKINAPDQNDQITRYIENVVKRYINPNSGEQIGNINNRVAVIYLSKSRSKPNKSSISGFNIKENSTKMLHWNESSDSKLHKNFPILFNLKPTIPFVHYDYINDLTNWSKTCEELTSIINLNNAFKEYSLILAKLNPNKKWKKIMSLADYAISLNEIKQQELYEFMINAEKNLLSYVTAKIASSIESINNPNYKADPINADKEKISIWLERRGSKENWKNQVVLIKEWDKDNNVVVLLAIDYMYISLEPESKTQNELKNIGKDIKNKIELKIEGKDFKLRNCLASPINFNSLNEAITNHIKDYSKNLQV